MNCPVEIPLKLGITVMFLVVFGKILDLGIDLLTLKMTLYHDRNTRNGYFSPLVPTFMILLIETLKVHMSPSI